MTHAPGSSIEDGSGPSTSAVVDAVGSRVARRRPLSLSLWQELSLLAAVALALAFVIKGLFLQAFYIPSASMNDTLVKDDRIVVQKVSFWFGDPHRGDVVVFADPGGWLTSEESREASNPLTKGLEKVGLYPAGGHLVKRVIGVAGDEVRCCDTRGRITVNEVPLNEKSYLAAGERPSTFDFDVKVHKGYVWVQGDNRSHSADSRAHLGDPGAGQVPVEDLVGKVMGVVWPLGHAALLSTPATFHSVR